MDIKKIGNFIKESRKTKGYKQKELADILHISDKTVSRWETGSGLPEMSMLMPLCEALEISINELLNGEKQAVVNEELLNDTIAYSIQEIETNQKNYKKKSLRFVLCCMSIVLLVSVLNGIGYLWNQRKFSATEVGVNEIKVMHDEDQDGLSDPFDMVESARAYIHTQPVFKSVYYAGGYPNDQFGVACDVIWQAFKGAGYDFKKMMDEDIADNPKTYPYVIQPDPNIDFRRIPNIQIFLERHAEKMSTFLDNPNDFQPGDILIYHDNIVLCSDIRNKDGFPFVIHLDPSGAKEDNSIQYATILGHYRFKYK